MSTMTFFFSSRRRHTRYWRDWSSDVCSSDLFGVIYSVYQFAIPYVMMGTNPGPYADLLMTLVVRQAFTNNLFGYGAAISSLLMLAMLGWVAVWYLSFRRSLQESYT